LTNFRATRGIKEEIRTFQSSRGISHAPIQRPEGIVHRFLFGLRLYLSFQPKEWPNHSSQFEADQMVVFMASRKWHLRFSVLTSSNSKHFHLDLPRRMIDFVRHLIIQGSQKAQLNDKPVSEYIKSQSLICVPKAQCEKESEKNRARYSLITVQSTV
jgi:hypothetical protein